MFQVLFAVFVVAGVVTITLAVMRASSTDADRLLRDRLLLDE